MLFMNHDLYRVHIVLLVWYSQFPFRTQHCGGMYGLPLLAGLGQHLPPAVD